MYLIDLHIGSGGRSVNLNLTSLVYTIKSWHLLDRSEQSGDEVFILAADKSSRFFKVFVDCSPISGSNDALTQGTALYNHGITDITRSQTK